MIRKRKGPVAINTDVRILKESPSWIAVDKPAPLLVHPTNETDERTLWHELNDLLLFELATGGQLSLVNRLDRETSGITLAAKTAEAARVLGKAMQARLFVRGYVALVYGHPGWEELKVEEPILRQGERRESRIWVKQCVHPEGKECVTEFSVQKRFVSGDKIFSLVRCTPHTGRMHQIRVHLAHVGHPVVGDKIYGPSEDCYLQHMETGWTPQLETQLWLPRQALHASSLAFPFDGEEVRIESVHPADWTSLLEGAEEA